MSKKLYLASLNFAKIEATKKVFNECEIIPTQVDINISTQPLSDLETIGCARKRALALPKGYRLGLEAGVTIVGDICFLVNYGVLIDPNDNEYYAGGSYLPLPNFIKDELYNHLELKEAMTKHYGDILKESGGTIEILTNGEVSRVDIFTHINLILIGELKKGENNG